MPRPHVLAIDHEFGEKEAKYSEVVHFDGFLAEHKIPRKPDLYGWGRYYRTERDVIDLGLAAAKKTIARSGVPASEIDAILFCCISFPGDKYQHNAYVARIVSELETFNAMLVGMTLNNCLTLLSALSVADALVKSGDWKNVLVVSADKVADESERLHKFALFSDAAVSCLVTSRPLPGYRILARSFSSDRANLAAQTDLTQKALYKTVLENLLTGSGINVREIKRVFATNLFKPITILKEQQIDG